MTQPRQQLELDDPSDLCDRARTARSGRHAVTMEAGGRAWLQVFGGRNGSRRKGSKSKRSSRRSTCLESKSMCR
jgi:hypothetical protein